MNILKKFPPLKPNKAMPQTVDISLSALLGIDITNSSSLTINIIDDLPTNINFNHTVGISTNKNFFLAALNKLFINPKSLKDESKVKFENFEKHVLEVEEQITLNQNKVTKCNCSNAKKIKKKQRISFIKEKSNACSC